MDDSMLGTDDADNDMNQLRLHVFELHVVKKEYSEPVKRVFILPMTYDIFGHMFVLCFIGYLSMLERLYNGYRYFVSRISSF